MIHYRWFTSDIHAYHANVIKFGKRPWDTVESMNIGLAENINKTVNEYDELYILGDFAYKHKKGEIGNFFNLLNKNFRKFLIIGNHETKEVLELPWNGVYDYKELSENGNKLIVSHYPMRSWNGMYNGSYHLFGHEHGNIPNYSHFETPLKRVVPVMFAWMFGIGIQLISNK